jgi:2-methylcitrate dehydratase PrpD
MTENVTKLLGCWAAEWKGDASERARETARMAFFDTIACMVAGAGDEAPAALRRGIAGWGDGQATILGSRRKAPAPWAALANGTAAHALDYDDGIHIGPAHVSAVLVPALLALAEEKGAAGRSLIDAYIVGVEVLARVAEGVGRSHYEAGWHGTSTLGTIGAAAACGRLLGLDADGMASAIGLSVSMSAGPKAQFGSQAKPFHAGMSAQNGIIAATLAAAGLVSGADPLGHRLGFRKLYAGPDTPGWDDLAAKLANPLAIDLHGIGTKINPCCRATHRSIDGLLDLMAQHRFTENDVAGIETVVAFSSAQNLMYPDPQDEMQARFSMPYVLSVVLHRAARPVLSDFTPAAVARPEIRRLLPLVKMEGMQPQKTDGQPTKRAPCLTRVTLKDGRVLESRVQHALGTTHNPMKADQFAAKFRDCTLGFLPDEDIAAAESSLLQFDKADIRQLLSHLRFDATADRGERFARRIAAE